MAETFLNTPGNTGMATSNVQSNLNQANNQNMPNANAISNAQQPVNPITIPIQIQPQVAMPAQAQTQQNINSNLQLGNTSNTQEYNAPSPQKYNNTTQNTNVVDFNKIYNSYNQSLGRNIQNNTINPNANKTSYNTTIVTPTTENLNSVEGKYQSTYSDTINSVISTMLSQMENLRTGNFGYDPTQDSMLRLASEYAANSTLQSLAGSGVLNSSATSERVARIVSELIPQYEEKAYNRQVQYLSQLADTAQLIMNFDNQQFDYWRDAKDREFKEKELKYEQEQRALDNAWKRVDELGFVDNDASAVLGVKVGTLSGQARLAKEQREFELEKMKQQAEIEHANNVALTKLKVELETQQSMELASYNALIEKELAKYKNQLSTQSSKELASYNNMLDRSMYEYKSKIDTQNSKELASYNSMLEKELTNYKTQLQTQQSKTLAAYENSLKQNNMKYEYDLAKKYGTSSNSNSSSTTSLSTYKDIINNRFADYDEFSKKYTVSNNADLYNYLVTEYSSGRMSASDLANLTAMYNVTQPTNEQLERKKYLEYLDSLG